ncbi:PsbP [Rivularia sp. PCC 7116]|uniref:photosystem II reaction center PsbP n=1 Tax=Rivularia sp. PCC 7116 TaxID=373994 RepID=UPI00029F4670|nr:photosystem II reaction center PsbP [Rivularia sp. PCC 7116]AFY54097.1 PsbP [Rivularia sp. PCC 7116]
MWKRISITLFLVLSFCLTNIGTAAAAALNSYSDSTDGYQFLYPAGWVEIQISKGPDVVFHDIIETTENVSVVISPVPSGKSLTELGTPTEVGYKLGKNALAPEGSNRKAELVNAEQTEGEDGKTYYLLEYLVKFPNNRERHNLASMAVSRGKLFTFNASVPQRRWNRMRRLIQDSVGSFRVD